MKAKRTIQAIGFFGVALLTVLAGCATSVSDGGGGGTGNTCDAVFSGTPSCLSGCSGAEQACAAAGQSGAFTTFLSCASNAGYTCPGGAVSINNGNCSNESAAISACASGMGSGDAGPTPTTTPNPTGTGTTPPGGKDSGTGAKDSGGGQQDSAAGGSCTTCANTAQNTGGQCSSAATACTNDPSCATLVSCLNACSATDTTCQNNCGTAASMQAVTEYNNVGNCICTTCASPCAADCSSGPTDSGTGPVDSGGPPPPTDSGSTATCMTCATTAQAAGGKCFTDVTACMNDQSCVDLVNCLNACAPTDMTCSNNCGAAATQSAITEYNNLGNCICTTACLSQCATECGP